ncbi:MFS transporter [Kribbella sp. NPDC020789]
MTKLLPAPGPLRPLALATLLSRIGNGLLMTISVLYFNRIVGLPVAEIGLGLTVAGIFGLFASVPFGHLADRRGPRTLFVLLSLLLSVLAVLYLVIDSFWQFLAVSIVVTILDRGANSVRFALIAGVTQGSAERVAARAYLRSMTNIGVTAGAGLGAIALSFGTATSYRLMYGVYVVLGVVAALIVLAVPRVAPQPKTEGPVWIALRDRRYLAVAGLNAAITIHYSVIDIAIPLWVVDHTDAPHWAAALPLFVNAAGVAVLQVRASRGIVDTAAAARATRTAGFLLLAAMVLFAGASIGDNAVVAIVVLAVAALVQVAGELLQSSGSFLLGFDLAAEHAQGQYQGVWNTSTSVSSMLAPAVMALLPLGLGIPGWIILGVWFAVVGALFVPVVRWAAARKPVSVS